MVPNKKSRPQTYAVAAKPRPTHLGRNYAWRDAIDAIIQCEPRRRCATCNETPSHEPAWQQPSGMVSESGYRQMRNPQIQAAFQMGLWQLSKMRRTCSSEQLPDPSVSHLLGFLLLGIQHARNATCTECEPFLNMHRFNMGVVLKTWKSNLACMTRVWQRLPRTFCRKRNSISYNIVKAMFDQSS